jgi:hypothetical protein
MDAVFPLKSKKSIKAFNQVVNHNNTVMRLKIQNALYQQELNRVKAANDSANAALALAQRQVHEAMVSTAAAAALAQHQSHEARVSAAAAAALAQHQARQAALAAANANKQELIATRNNTKSSKFGKLLSKMNKQH